VSLANKHPSSALMAQIIGQALQMHLPGAASAAGNSG